LWRVWRTICVGLYRGAAERVWARKCARVGLGMGRKLFGGTGWEINSGNLWEG
jgi:hypothetical protein